MLPQGRINPGTTLSNENFIKDNISSRMIVSMVSNQLLENGVDSNEFRVFRNTAAQEAHSGSGSAISNNATVVELPESWVRSGIGSESIQWEVSDLETTDIDAPDSVESGQVQPLGFVNTGYTDIHNTNIIASVFSAVKVNVRRRNTQLYEPAEQFYAITQQKANRAFPGFSFKIQSITTYVDHRDSYKNALLDEMLERLNAIAQREDNWDGLGSMKPNNINLYRAKYVMMKLLNSVIANGDKWIEPYICSDEDGYITVEWYGDERELHLRIEEDEVEYTELESINSKIKTHVNTVDGEDCFALWKWLINE